MMRSWPPGGATLISGAPLTNAPRLHASRPAHPVLHFEPIGRAAGTVGRVLPLRDDAFKTQCASMGEDGRAVHLHVFVEPDAGASLGHDRASVALPRGDSASFRGIAEAECLLVNAIRYDAKHNHDQGQHEDDQFSRLGAYAGRSILLTSAVSFEPK